VRAEEEEVIFFLSLHVDSTAARAMSPAIFYDRRRSR
jgi:hypothetical protein